MSKIDELTTAVVSGKSKQVAAIVEDGLKENSALELLDAMIAAMGKVGDQFSAGEIFVPEMLVSARAMQKGVEVLKPSLAEAGRKSLGKCIIGTVQGDLHDIGKNLVAIMIESAGFDVIDLGVDVTTEKFVECIDANPDVNIVALSGLLTTTMPSMEATAKALKAKGGSYKLLVGGAPITQEFAAQIGADAYAVDAGAAAVTAKGLV
ncbi:MAG: cobalamin-dependent protein [Eubacteriaceae bacterium]|jgi:methanogenic corrinoid protein MtbC1|nr:cobalamin-dependent protein [Eubacteriaceae bacterium]